MPQQEDWRALLPESYDILLDGLNAKVYTEKQLHQAAVWYVAPSLTLGSQLGVSDMSRIAVMTTANLFARTVMADFINKGLMSVTAIGRFMDEAEEIGKAEEAKRESSEAGEDSDSGIESPDAVQAVDSSE